jgi:hypothetical protein
LRCSIRGPTELLCSWARSDPVRRDTRSRSLQGAWPGGADRPVAPPVRYANLLPQQVEAAIVGLKRDKPHWGAPQAQGAIGTPLGRPCQSSCQEHDPRHAGSAWPGQARGAEVSPCHRHTPVVGAGAERSVVHRLQGRVQARQQGLLLSTQSPWMGAPAAPITMWVAM